MILNFCRVKDRHGNVHALEWLSSGALVEEEVLMRNVHLHVYVLAYALSGIRQSGIRQSDGLLPHLPASGV